MKELADPRWHYANRLRDKASYFSPCSGVRVRYKAMPGASTPLASTVFGSTVSVVVYQKGHPCLLSWMKWIVCSLVQVAYGGCPCLCPVLSSLFIIRPIFPISSILCSATTALLSHSLGLVTALPGLFFSSIYLLTALAKASLGWIQTCFELYRCHLNISIQSISIQILFISSSIFSV